jgi:hypothetical protein
MENKTFEFNIKESPEEMVRNVANFARKYNMYFKGDSKKGVFSGGPHILGLNFKFTGNYVTKGSKVLVTVTEKPALVSWDQTGKVLSDFFDKGLRPP